MSSTDSTEQVKRVASEFIEVTSTSFHSEGSNDYKNEYHLIERVVDRDGIEYEPVWGDKTTELCPGVTSRTRDGGNRLRIERAACPVRILFCHHREYVSYDNWEHNTSSKRHYWIRYEASG